MRKLVFDKFYIDMNEQDIAQIISEFLMSASKGNIAETIHEWRFQICSLVPSEHEILLSYKLKKLEVEKIELCLKQFHSLDIKFTDVTLKLATDNYIVVYRP